MLHLGLLVTANGAHAGAWRLPDAIPQEAYTLHHYVNIARTAERGLLDFLFFADTLALQPSRNPANVGRTPPIAHLEPFTLLAALSAVTTHIGLAGSATTTYNPPYQVARVVASLDHISHGRAAWNLVTSANPAEACNFGYDSHPDKADRYTRASEFADVVLGLWDCWSADAFIYDKQAGQYFDPAKLRALDHDGAHFKVKGPLTMPRTPQGRPVVAQAGSSPDGRALAARTADIVFTAQQDFAGAKAFYDDMHHRLAASGRPADAIVILPGVVPIAGRTQAEADAKFRHLQQAFDPALGIDVLSAEFGIDMSIHPLDRPLRSDLPPSPIANSRRDLLLAQARRENLTLRELAARTASLGHWTLCGTPQTIVDTLQDWHARGAADGFMIMPASFPAGLDDVVDLVVPELQRRGLFRTAYQHHTLRGNLGIATPPMPSMQIACAR